MQLIVQPDGKAKCVYDESINLEVLGRLRITRGSLVEPTAEGRWTADLGPCGGPVLGPFGLRSEALAAERVWLVGNWLESQCGAVDGW